MSTIDISERLKDMDALWQGAEANTGGTAAPVPDGEYQASVYRFDFFDSKKNGNLTMVTEFEIVAPNNLGSKVRTFHDLEDADRLGWAKGHLAMLGVENVNPLSDLEDRLAEALDQVCEIALVSKKVGDKTFQNVYLNAVVKGVKTERAKPAAPAEVDDTDDIPF